MELSEGGVSARCFHTAGGNFASCWCAGTIDGGSDLRDLCTPSMVYVSLWNHTINGSCVRSVLVFAAERAVHVDAQPCRVRLVGSWFMTGSA